MAYFAWLGHGEQAHEAVDKGQGDIGPDAEIGDDAFALAFGRDETDSSVAALARVGREIWNPREGKAGVGQRPQCAVDGPAKLVNPRAEQAEDAEDLAAVEREGHAIEGTGQAQIFDLQRNLADVRVARRVEFVHRGAEHGVENFAPRSRGRGKVAGV